MHYTVVTIKMCNTLFPLLFIICVMQGLIICVRARVRVCVLGWCVCVGVVCVCWGGVCVGVGGVEFRSLCVRFDPYQPPDCDRSLCRGACSHGHIYIYVGPCLHWPGPLLFHVIASLNTIFLSYPVHSALTLFAFLLKIRETIFNSHDNILNKHAYHPLF